MARYRLREAAELLGVSDDTVRRWVEAGRLQAHPDESGVASIDGAALAEFAQQQRRDEPDRPIVAGSARNRFPGLVTRVVKDAVMAQVEIQAGPHRVVSLLSREAVDQLGLEPGSRAVATVKATNVVVEVPQ